MNSRRLSLLIVLSVLCVGAAKAQTVQSTPTVQTADEDTWGSRFAYRPDEPKYYDHELSVDGFGTYNKNFHNFGDQFDRDWHHGKWGGGVGLNYFFTRYVGVGVNTFFEPEGQFFKNVSGSLFLRAPIGNSGFAPYGFAGGGGRFDPVDEAEGHVGVGAEFRLNRYLGIFSDIRYAWADKTENNTLVRLGLRFAFDVGSDERR